MTHESKSIVIPEPHEKRAVHVVLQFLREQNLKASFNALLAESGFDPAHYSLHDNVDDEGYLHTLCPSHTLLKALDEYFQGEDKRSSHEGHPMNVQSEDSLNAARTRQLEQDMIDRLSPLNDRLDLVIPSENVQCIQGLHSKNILGVRFCPGTRSKEFITLSSDQSVQLYNRETQCVTWSIDLSSLFSTPITSHFNQCFTHLLAIGCMDGSVYILNTNHSGESSILQQFEDHHRKFVFRVRWSSDGTLLASAGADHIVHIYKSTSDLEGNLTWILVKTLEYLGNPESIEWLPSEDALAIAVTDESFIRLIDRSTLKERHRVHVNTNSDLHVSFRTMDMCTASSHSYFCAITDASRAILLHPTSPRPIRAFYGAKNDEYSTPRSVFGAEDAIVYLTSQDNTIVMWDLRYNSPKYSAESNALRGHLNRIRCLDYDRSTNSLATGSYDKTVHIWGD